MTRIRILLLCTGLLLALAACDRGDKAEAPTADANPLLGYVPADTPYLAADLAPVPEEVLDAWLVRLQPVLDEMQAQLSQARGELAGTADTEEAFDEPAHGLLSAVLREFDGKLNRPGLESLGFDLRAHRVFYGLGAFPVFRFGLSDPEALRATVVRVLDAAGLPSAEQEFQGARYWRLGGEPGSQPPVALLVSIREDHFAAALLPAVAEAELLPAFLGLEKPADADAGQRLVALNRSRGYTPYGSAIVDLHRLADDVLQPGGLVHRALAAEGMLDEGIAPECVTEIHSIIDNVPRITAGITELSVTEVHYRSHAETPASLAARLLPLASDIPAVDAASGRLLEFAFGMRFGPVRDFLREQAAAIVAQPYACSHLLDINTSAADLETRLAQPMPPFLNNFRGIRVGVDELSLTGDFLNTAVRGQLALHVEQPEMFVGMAQMFLPDLSALKLAAGEPPVPLPASLLPRPDLVAHAAMSSSAIGLSVGAGEEQGLVDYLEQDAAPKGSFLSFSYDMAAYLDYSDAMAELARSGEPESADEMPQAAQAIGEAARTAFRAMADRSHTEMRFAEDGVVVDAQLRFKPLP